jgi:hypothetical protein
MKYKVKKRDIQGKKWIRFEGMGGNKSSLIWKRNGGLAKVFGLNWSELQIGTEVEIMVSKDDFDEIIK